MIVSSVDDTPAEPLSSTLSEKVDISTKLSGLHCHLLPFEQTMCFNATFRPFVPIFVPSELINLSANSKFIEYSDFWGLKVSITSFRTSFAKLV